MGTADRSRTRVVLLVALAALVALAGCNGAQLGESAGGGDGGDAASQGLGSQERGGDGTSSYYRGSDRVVVREADASVRVENVTRSFRRLRAIAARHGGFVGDRRMRSEGEWDTATVTVRVPAGNFSAARDAVADLGRLESENVRALDFTGEFRDRQRRIRQLERDRRRLAGLLNRTENASAASDLRDELGEVRSQLRDLRRDQSRLRERQALSTIEVRVHEPESRKPAQTFETAFGFGDAFAQAFNGGLTAVKFVIVFFGYAIPVGFATLLLGTFGFGLLQVWRRLQAAMERAFDRRGRSPTGRTDATGDDGDGDGDGDDPG